MINLHTDEAVHAFFSAAGLEKTNVLAFFFFFSFFPQQSRSVDPTLISFLSFPGAAGEPRSFDAVQELRQNFTAHFESDKQLVRRSW